MAVRFEEHYASIAPKLTNWLVANGCGYATACDVVQETFLRVWKMRDDLDDDASMVSGLHVVPDRRVVRPRNRATHERERSAGESAHFPRQGKTSAAAERFVVTFFVLCRIRGRDEC